MRRRVSVDRARVLAGLLGSVLGAVVQLGCGASEPRDATGFPCDVESVLRAKCWRCHGDSLENGAPFSLTTLDAAREVYVGLPIVDRMLPAIESGFMPFTALTLDPPVAPLDSQEVRVLEQWLGAGAAAATRTCQ